LQQVPETETDQDTNTNPDEEVNKKTNPLPKIIGA